MLIRGSTLTVGQAPRQDILDCAFLVNISLFNGLINLSVLRYGGLGNAKDYNLGREVVASAKVIGGRID